MADALATQLLREFTGDAAVIASVKAHSEQMKIEIERFLGLGTEVSHEPARH